MLAYRTTRIVKEGHAQEALKAISAEIGRVRKDVVTRVPTPDISPNVLVFETVFENEAAHRAFWDAYDRDSLQGEAFRAKWGKVTERSVGTDR